MLGSRFDLERYPVRISRLKFFGFPQSLQENAWVVSLNRLLRLLPDSELPVLFNVKAINKLKMKQSRR